MKNMRWLLETHFKKEAEKNDNQRSSASPCFFICPLQPFLQPLFFDLHPFQHILAHTDVFVTPAKENLYISIMT